MPSFVDIVSTYILFMCISNCGSSFLLVRHPKVLDKLREEIKSSLGEKSDFNRDDLRRLPYLQNVLKESKKPLVSHISFKGLY